MKKRYIISLNDSTVQMNDNFRKFIKENNLGWWHWINNTWLLTDYSGKFNASILLDKLEEIYPNIYKLVFELNPSGDTWAGFGPNGKERNMFTWIENNWKNN